MDENETTEGLPTGPTPREVGEQRRERIQAEVAVLMQEEQETQTEAMVQMIRDMGGEAPRTTPVQRVPENYVPGAVRGSISQPTDPLYARLPKAEQGWRNPESDHNSAQWIRSLVRGDTAGRLLADSRIVEMYGRAIVTEGVAAGTGVFATGTGGEFLPRPLEAVVEINRDAVAKGRALGTLYQMTRQEHNIPTQAAMTAGMVAEGATHTAGEGAVAQVPLIARKAQCVAGASVELLDDSAFNVVSIFASRAGGALGVLEDDQVFRLGTGSAPNITALTGAAFTENTSGALDFTNDVLGMYRELDQVYRGNAMWLVASNVLTMLTAVRDGNGRPLYDGLLAQQMGVIGDDPGQVGTLLRRPVIEVPFSDGNIWFGDPKASYAFGSRQGIQVKASEHVAFSSDQIVWKFTERIAGINVDTVNSTRFAQGITSANSL